MRKLANLRALYGQPITNLQGVPERLDTMIDRYYALAATGEQFRPREIAYVAHRITSALEISEESRAAVCDELCGHIVTHETAYRRGVRLLDLYGRLHDCDWPSWAMLIEEVEDFRARSQLGL